MSVFAGRLVTFENLEEGEPMHMSGLNHRQTLGMWQQLARGEMAALLALPWQPGYGDTAAGYVGPFGSITSTRARSVRMGRSLLTFVVGLGLGVGGWAFAQHEHGDANGPAVKVLSSVDIEEEVGAKKATTTTFEVTFEPGVTSNPHRHPGPIFGYVLEGELEFAVGEDKPKTLKAGDTFYEPALALHGVSRNPSDTARTRVLAVLVHPRDAKELVIPEPAKKGTE